MSMSTLIDNDSSEPIAVFEGFNVALNQLADQLVAAGHAQRFIRILQSKGVDLNSLQVTNVPEDAEVI